MDLKDPNNNNKNKNNKFKHIVVANEIYEQLRNRGKLGDSFNDVVKRLLGHDTNTPLSTLKDKEDIQEDEKDKVLFDEERGLGNQRSYQTKSSKSTILTKEDESNNSIYALRKKILEYCKLNASKINHERKIVNTLLQQIQNSTDAIKIPISFFENDVQLQSEILQIPSEILEEHLKYVFKALSGEKLSNRKIKVM